MRAKDRSLIGTTMMRPETQYKYKNENYRGEAVSKRQQLQQRAVFVVCMAFGSLVSAGWILFTLLGGNSNAAPYAGTADGHMIEAGYVYKSKTIHLWGQYSPYFAVASAISPDVPRSCTISFAQVLSRHGARYPTVSKGAAYAALVSSLKSRVRNFTGKYTFLAEFNYTLGADDLTEFGKQEMAASGSQFYERYNSLVQGSEVPPFLRSSSEARVVDSAQNWADGFHHALSSGKNWSYPYDILTLSERAGGNNTLSHGLCTAFESGSYSEIGSNAQKKWAGSFVPPIQTRLNNGMPGANLSTSDVVSLMDLCPFETVNTAESSPLSPFCYLFSNTEWMQYDYYQSLGKYYGYGPGNPLGPTQGVGFVNELIARLIHSPVNDSTSTNRTLDSDPQTFPTSIMHRLFADFSHDNDITGILGALGLYHDANLSNTNITPASRTGYSAAWTVPFAARVYVEKMTCDGSDEELVRILVNDRVAELANCNVNHHGMCRLSEFVRGLSFARNGGEWSQCFN